jgi:hypothetical protein
MALVLGAAIAGTSCKTGEDAPSFALSATNSTAELLQGTTGTLLIAVTRANGFTGDIELTLLGTLPAGVTAEFSQNPVPDGEPTVNIAFTVPASIAPGETELTVKASGEGVADQTLPITLKVNLKGSHSVSFPTPTLTVAQGGGGSATLNIPRTDGNGGLVTLTANAPAGITATFGESPTSATGTTVAIAAGAAVAAGNYPVTVTATQAGVTATPQATLTVTVVAPKPTTDVTLTFCSDFVPDWVAYQNEGFNWKQVQPAGNVFTFAATDKVGLAYTFVDFGIVVVTYATRQELAAAIVPRVCFGTRTLTGTAANIGTATGAWVRMGLREVEIINNGFTLDFLPPSALDLSAVRGTDSPTAFIPDKMIVRRGITTASGALPVLDFGAGEAFDPAANTLTLTGLGTDAYVAQSAFGGQAPTVGALASPFAFNILTQAAPAGAVSTIHSLPVAQAVAGDLHELFVNTQNLQNGTLRWAFKYYSTAADHTLALAPTLNPPTVTAVTTAPYLRTRAQLESQSAYATSARFYMFQGSKQVQVETTAGFMGGVPTTWEITTPDLTSATGFSTAWMPLASVDVDWVAVAMSGRPEFAIGFEGLPGAGAPPVAGDILNVGLRGGSLPAVTGGAALRVAPARPAVGRGRRPSVRSSFFSVPR